MTDIEKAKLNVEIGSTGLKTNRGTVQEEFLRDLRGSRGIKVYREMSENDPIINACLTAVKWLLKRVTWTCEPASDSPQDLEAANFVDECREDMSSPWSDLVGEILSFCTYGWSLHEIVYKRRSGPSRNPSTNSRFTDGRIGWRKIPIRAQETLYEWVFDESGGIQGMRQQDPNRGGPPITIPIEKALLFRTQIEKGNPEGRSLLRSPYVPWYRKKHIEITESIGIERDLAGYPVAWVPPEILSLTPAGDFGTVKANIETTMANIRRDEEEYLLWPLDYDEKGNKRWDFTLVSSPGTRQFDTSGVINRYNRDMTISFLADVIIRGHEKVGSYALSVTKHELFSLGLEALIQQVVNVFNRIAIPRLFEINAWQLEEYPELRVGDVERVDLKELGQYVKDTAAAGMPWFPDTEVENELRRAAKLPDKAEEDALAPPESQWHTPATPPNAGEGDMPSEPPSQPVDGEARR